MMDGITKDWDKLSHFLYLRRRLVVLIWLSIYTFSQWRSFSLMLKLWRELFVRREVYQVRDAGDHKIMLFIIELECDVEKVL